MENKYMLTTFDNPYNPFVDFVSWYMFDCENGYNTSSHLARIVNLDNEMTQKEVDEERNRAIDLMLEYDFEGNYFKGTEEEINKWLETRKSNVETDKTDEKVSENDKKQNATATNA